jgi:hypothetical protein
LENPFKYFNLNPTKMKQSVFLSIGCPYAFLNLTAQDTTNPPANLQALPAGGYVIAMDNTHQANTHGVAGRRVMQQQTNSYKGNNLVSLPLPACLNKGIYIVDVMEGAERQSLKFIKN